jgi:uncharacterized membrane protein required for colicin V production
MILFTALGFRDGIVRKAVAIVVIIAGLILGQLFMRDVGNFFAGNGWVESSSATTDGFLIIFLGLVLIQGLLYRLLTGCYKIGGIADRICGSILGFMEGMLFLSCIFYIFTFSGFPDREMSRDTRLYKPVVNIAPQILDLTSSLNAETVRTFNVGTSGKDADSSSATSAKKQNEVLNNARKTGGK